MILAMDKSRAREQRSTTPTDNELVQLGVRIPRGLHFRLKEACLHQERDGKMPLTQAEVVADAIRLWLEVNGYDR